MRERFAADAYVGTPYEGMYGDTAFKNYVLSLMEKNEPDEEGLRARRDQGVDVIYRYRRRIMILTMDGELLVHKFLTFASARRAFYNLINKTGANL